MLPGTVTHHADPQSVYASESLTQVMRQLQAYGRDGLPVLSADGLQVLGWITTASVLDAVAGEISGSPPEPAAENQGTAPSSPQAPEAEPPNPLSGYQVLEITLAASSPAAGQPLGAVSWPDGYLPVSVLRGRSLEEPDPALTLSAGDRVSLLAPATQHS